MVAPFPPPLKYSLFGPAYKDNNAPGLLVPRPKRPELSITRLLDGALPLKLTAGVPGEPFVPAPLNWSSPVDVMRRHSDHEVSIIISRPDVKAILPASSELT